MREASLAKNIPAGNTDALKRQLRSLEEEQARMARQPDQLNFERPFSRLVWGQH
jgi:hypothetical protein